MPRSAGDSRTLDAFGRSFKREVHTLLENGSLSFQQLHNRLQWEELSAVRLLLERERRRRPRGDTWLRTRFPPPESPALVRTVSVTCPNKSDSVGAGVGVLDCAFSPDGRVVATAGERSVILWDVGSGVELLRFDGHEDTVWACDFSPAGTTVVSASHDHTLRLWDARSGAPIGLLEGHAGPVVGCAFSPDATRVVSASWDNTVRIWDLSPTGGSIVVSPSGTPQEEIDAGGDYRRRVDACAFSPDGTAVLSVADRGLAEWDARTGERLRASWTGHTFCAYSPDGGHIVSGGQALGYRSYQNVTVWDRAGRGEATDLIGHHDQVTDAAFSPDGQRVATASQDKTLRIRDLENGLELTTLTGHGGDVLCCAYSPDGALLASGGDDGTLRFWDTARVEQTVTAMRHQDPIWACAFSHDGSRIVSGSENLYFEERHRNLTIWDAETGEPVAQPAGHDGGVSACTFSPDDTQVASVSKRLESTVALWDSRTGAALGRLQPPTPVEDCAFSPSGAEIIAASRDGTVRVWNLVDGSELAPLVGPQSTADTWEWLQCCAFTPDGQTVAGGGSDGLLRLWDFRSGVNLGVLTGVEGSIECCAFSPDGRLLVAGGFDHTLTVWDTATRAVVTLLRGHTDVVRSCDFSPSGGWVVSGSDDGTARVWDPVGGRQIATLPVVGGVNAVAAHPRLSRFACGGTDGVLHVLDVIRH